MTRWRWWRRADRPARIDPAHTRRLVEIDGRLLQEGYGHRAEAHAMHRDARGADYLWDGRAPGHWRQVAAWMRQNPLPSSGFACFSTDAWKPKFEGYDK